MALAFTEMTGKIIRKSSQYSVKSTNKWENIQDAMRMESIINLGRDKGQRGKWANHSKCLEQLAILLHKLIIGK